jgi:hypothetical protein
MAVLPAQDIRRSVEFIEMKFRDLWIQKGEKKASSRAVKGRLAEPCLRAHQRTKQGRTVFLQVTQEPHNSK